MPASPLDVALQRIGEIQQPLPAPVTVLIGLAVLVLTVLPGVWLVVKRVDTVAHEGAHALVASTCGGEVAGVTVNADGTGATGLWISKGLGFFLSLVVGYLGPSGFGLGAAKLISLGHPVAVLWAALFLLALLFPTLRNTFGKVVVLTSGALLYSLVRYTPVGMQVAAAYGITWLLLVSGVRTVLMRGVRASDAYALAEWTHLPRVLWVGLWLAGALMALGLGGDLLLA